MGLISIAEFMEPRNDLARKHRGVVVYNNDPDKRGRIKVFIEGVLEGAIQDLPWCYPVLPANSGGSPDNLSFSVPSVGSETQVTFMGNQYTPVYDGTWINSRINPSNVFGEDYPNTSGEINSTGLLRRNAIQKTLEFYHTSGIMLRVDENGNTDVSSDGSITIRADKGFFVNDNYTKNGGGGLGSVLDEISYAFLNAPFMRGILDIISLLPENVDLKDFCSDLRKLSSFVEILRTVAPDFSDLKDKMMCIEDSKRIKNSFQSLGGVEGVLNIMFLYFGLFGVYTSSWLGDAEYLMNALISSLDSPYFMEKLLRGNKEDLEEILSRSLTESESAKEEQRRDKAQSEITLGILDDLSRGFNALLSIAPILEKCDEVRQVVDVYGTDRPYLLFNSLENDLREFVFESMQTTLDGLLEATEGISVESRMTFLERFGISRYFAEMSSSTAIVKTVIEQLLETGADPWDLGRSGEVVGAFLLLDLKTQNQNMENLKNLFKKTGMDISLILKHLNLLTAKQRQRMTGEPVIDDSKGEDDTYASSLVRLVTGLIGHGIFKTRVMTFISELGINSPVAEYTDEDSAGNPVRHVQYLSSETVLNFLTGVKELRNNPRKGDEDGRINGEISLSEDLENMGEGTGGGGTTIPGHVLSHLGEGIGSLCKAIDFYTMAPKYLGSALAAKIYATDDRLEEEEDYDPFSRLLEDIYLWFMSANIPDVSERMSQIFVAKEMNQFLTGLDPHGLLRKIIPIAKVRYTVQTLSGSSRPRASYAYGVGLHRILSSGISEISETFLFSEIARIEKEIYMNNGLPPSEPWKVPQESLSPGCYYPKAHWYSMIYGAPSNGVQRGQDSSGRKSKELELSHNRATRLGDSFRTTNFEHVADIIDKGDCVVEI